MGTMLAAGTVPPWCRAIPTLLAVEQGCIRGGEADALLGSRAEIAEGAEAAVIAGFRFEGSGLNFVHYILDAVLRGFQVHRAAATHHRGIVFEVVEDQAVGHVSPLALGGQGID